MIVALVLATLAGIFVFLLFFGGKDFAKALWVISRTENEGEKVSVWREFAGNYPKGPYGGILAGSAFDRVWVWTGSGLKGFSVDEYSVYSWYDGCNSEVLELLNMGQAGVVPRYLATDISDWRQKAKAGDYVRVFTTQPKMDSKIGSLREIYAYNFWLFMPWGMEERCAK